MSLEEATVENTAALKALTAVMAGGKPAGAATAAVDGKRPPGRPRKVTLAEVKAMAEKVKEDKGREQAVELIVQHGAKNLAELDESKYAAFIAAAEVVLAGGDDGDAGDADL